MPAASRCVQFCLDMLPHFRWNGSLASVPWKDALASLDKWDGNPITAKACIDRLTDIAKSANLGEAMAITEAEVRALNKANVNDAGKIKGI